MLNQFASDSLKRIFLSVSCFCSITFANVILVDQGSKYNQLRTEYEGSQFMRLGVYSPAYLTTGICSSSGCSTTLFPATTEYPYDKTTTNGISYRVYGYPMTRTNVYEDYNAYQNGSLVQKSKLVESYADNQSLGFLQSNPGAYQLKIFQKVYSDGGMPNGRLDPPVVICQGFDPEYGTTKAFSFESFEKKLGPAFIDKILESGHSIILLRYNNVTLKIEDNANAALKAFQWIQSQSPNSDMVLVGPSMGGLIFRKALINAGYLNQAAGNSSAAGFHPSIFIAYDSPNWGAVIPISIQACARYFGTGGIKNVTNSQKVQLRNLTSPGASEMLLYQVPKRTKYTNTLTLNGYFWDPVKSNVTTTTASKFLRELNSAANWAVLKELKSQSGVPLRVLAVTDGSAAITQGLPEDTQIAKGGGSGDALYYHLWTGLPGQTSHVATLDAFDKYSWKLKFKEPVFTENMPGGMRDTYNGTWKGLKNADKDYAGTWNQAFMDQSDDNGNSIMRGHAFIPTASSAAIRATYADFNFESTWYLPYDMPILGHSLSWFDKVYVNPYNEEHIATNPLSPAKASLSNIILGE